MTLPLKNMDDQFTHPPTPQQTIKPTAKNKQQHTHNNNHNKQTNNNKTTNLNKNG